MTGASNVEKPRAAIRVRHLWHRFGANLALQDVDFEVGAGEIYGFIGPNGAGKTTTIRIISTLLDPTAGRVEALRVPAGRGVRWDSGIEERFEVGLDYDPLLAKLITHAPTRDEAISQLRDAGLPIAPVQTFVESAQDPHVLERDMLQPTELQDGTTVPITGPAVKFSRTPTRVRSPAPELGEHNEEILEEFGIQKGD